MCNLTSINNILYFLCQFTVHNNFQYLFNSILNISDPSLQFIPFHFEFIVSVFGVQHKFCIFDDFLFHPRATLIAEYTTKRQTHRTIKTFTRFNWILNVIVIEQLEFLLFDWNSHDIVHIWKNGQLFQWQIVREDGYPCGCPSTEYYVPAETNPNFCSSERDFGLNLFLPIALSFS